MKSKSIIISSLGLKNIVLNKYQEEDFVFIFGEQQIQMKSFFAEFISPIVSRLHQTDPTINSINILDLNTTKNNESNELFKDILTEEIISLLLQISSGYSIEIDEEQAIKMCFLSILLGNEELHSKLNELFPPTYTEKNINYYLKNIECCYNFSLLNIGFDFTSLLSFLANHFYALNHDEFLKLSRRLQYQIISHPKFQIESEDSLFDIIEKIIEKKCEADEIDDFLFFEQIEFKGLSESRLREFVDVFDINEMSGPLWRKISQLFFAHSDDKIKRTLHKCKSYIIVGGCDKLNQLGGKPNNKSEDGELIINPPVKSSLDPSSLLSCSLYSYHSVVITNGGSLLGIGENRDGRISSSLAKAEVGHFTQFSIKDDEGLQLTPILAVCSAFGTLYMLSKGSNNERQLVYCDKFRNSSKPFFLDIGNKQPVALFSGYLHTAAITSEGEIIFIDGFPAKNSFESQVMIVSLPDDEKASSIACCSNSVVALSSKGRVFLSSIERGSNVLNFSAVEELAGKEIVCMSGAYRHFIAVSKEGSVFCCGSNDHGQLGLGEPIEDLSSFTEISSLNGYKIRAAYAGCNHSLFETNEGKILSCGNNRYGQLLINRGSNENVYSPTETMVDGGATFCIAGVAVSAVFVGSEPPPNQPNRRIQRH